MIVAQFLTVSQPGPSLNPCLESLGSPPLSGKALAFSLPNAPPAFSLQAAAAEVEDFEEAASLEDRIKKISERSAAASSSALQEEQRAAQLAERRQELTVQQGQVGRGLCRLNRWGLSSG